MAPFANQSKELFYFIEPTVTEEARLRVTR
jgi:hypothetical protein